MIRLSLSSKALLLSLVLLLTTLTVLPASAQTLADKWRAGLREVDTALRAGQWAAAEKDARKLGKEILAEGGIGEGATYSLAVVTAFRAIAEAGLGRAEDAAWHWDMALNLVPDLAKTDLSPYGDAVGGLKGRTLRSPVPFGPPPGWTGEPPLGTVTGIEPPKWISGPRPKYPKALGRMRSEGKVVVSAVIGTDGTMSYPLVHSAEGGGPGMRYIALETLREWRFEPARLDGKPVPVYYSLTVNFDFRD